MQNGMMYNGKNDKGKRNEADNVVNFFKTKIQEIPISQIKVGKYQKRLNKHRVAAIVREFDPNKMRPIEVSSREDCYWVWDGQHRLEAYKVMGKETIPCQIHFNLTYTDDCRLFAGQRDNTGEITIGHKYKALLEAEDPDIVAINNKCAEYGFTVRPNVSSGYNISAIRTLINAYKEHGESRLGDILSILETSWKHKEGSTSADIVKGISLFLARYMLPEDTKKEYNFNMDIIKRLKETLIPIDPTALMAETTKYQFTPLKCLRVAYALVDLYNQGLSKGSPRRLLRLEL